jgi:adhesin transport system membrane fusion protein
MTISAKKKTNSPKRERQTRFLSQAVQLEESVNPHIIRTTMVMASVAILSFLGWAAITNINEVARTPGEVVPYGYQQMVQHLEGGIVKSINVHEGDIVEKGHVLLHLNEESLLSDLERAKSKQLSLEMQAERLRAFVEDRTPDFSPFQSATETMISDQQAVFASMKDAREREKQIIEEQIVQKMQSISTLSTDIETAQSNLKIAQDVYSRKRRLNQRGYASDIQLLESEQNVNAAQGNIKNLQSRIMTAQTEMYEYEGRLQSQKATQRDNAYEKLATTLAEAEQNKKLIGKIEERLARLQIRAPTRGLVKGLAVNTIGAVVTPGQTLMEIVPLDHNLEVEVKIQPKDIGHLRIGQPVQVKFRTYDFSRYGSVTGELGHISATTFSGQEGERFYQGRIVLMQNHVGGNPENMIMPGMTVMADIITGEKTILQYLLKPIHRALRSAFTER